MIQQLRFIWLVLLGMVLIACGKDDTGGDDTLVKSGVFVANQGKFPDGNGSVTWIQGTYALAQDLFSNRNGSELLGNTVQSVFFNNGKYFIAVNNNKSVIITDESFKKLKDISVQGLPRYFAAWGNKTIATAWGNAGAQGSILLFNEKQETEKTVLVNGAPDKMLVSGNDLWVCISNGFGVDSLVLKYRLPDLTLTSTLKLSKGPNSMVTDQNGDIYILCEGYYDWLNAQVYPAALYKWTANNAIKKVFDLIQGSADLTISPYNNTCYFHDYNTVYQWKVGDANFKVLDLPIETSSIYGLEIDAPNNILYVSDPKDFSSQGAVIYTNLTTGTASSIPAGVAPGQIFIRN